MQPPALSIAMALVLSCPAARALEPCRDLKPLALTPALAGASVDLERSGLDVERALSLLTTSGTAEVTLAATVARAAPDFATVAARRCDAGACELVAARFRLDPATPGPTLVIARTIAAVGPGAQLGAVRALALTEGGPDEILVGWSEGGVQRLAALRVGDLGLVVPIMELMQGAAHTLEPGCTSRTTLLIDGPGGQTRHPVAAHAPLLEMGPVAGGRSTTFLTIWPDGRWEAKGTVGGTLTSAERDALVTAIHGARWVTTRTAPCPGRPERTFVRTPAGEVSYASGCGAAADPSALAVAEQAERLTTRRPHPVLLKLRRWEADATDRVESVAVMRTGAWTTHSGRGTLSANALAELIALLDAALIEAPPIPDVTVCRGDRPHELEVPGRGQIQYIWPCQRPSPTLEAALQRVYALVGMRAP
ncbi:MAG: hypothetical protein IT385_16645 [Deltaproteobacteria bacterium]|nr:hypothetical protein [Deltaproteobacteria bacterium]